MSFLVFQQIHLACPQGLVLVLLAYVILTPFCVLGLVIYNLFFHPLRSYSGPRLWAAFRFPYVYTQVKGLLPQRIKVLHDQYGPIVRVAPNELSYITPEAWKDIYGFRAGQTQLPKDLTLLPPTPEGTAPSLLIANDADHGRQRRLVSHAFSTKAVEEQHHLVSSYADLLVHKLQENAAQPQDLVAWYNWTTFDIIGDLSFGEPFFGLRDQYWHPWVSTITEGLQSGTTLHAIRRYGFSPALKLLMPKGMQEKYNQLFTYAKEKIDCRLKRGAERPDFMSHIMRNDKNGREMSRLEIEANARLIVVAGSESTASFLQAATYYLCMNPKPREKVTSEVRDAFDSDQDMSIHSVNKLDYLLAVINETLRIYPPAPGVTPRVAVSGAMIAGRWVPPGTIAGIWPWAAHHSPYNFHDCESFVPERWLPDAPAEFRGDNKDAFQPFSTGPRNCVGKNLAYLEMRLILAKILWNFDLSIEEESKHWNTKKILLVYEKKPLMIRLTPVNRRKAG